MVVPIFQLRFSIWTGCQKEGGRFLYQVAGQDFTESAASGGEAIADLAIHQSVGSLPFLRGKQFRKSKQFAFTNRKIEQPDLYLAGLRSAGRHNSSVASHWPRRSSPSRIDTRGS